MYASRNYGCRIQKDITINGLRAVVLENDRLEVTILVEKGADIIGINYKPMDVDFMWRSPYGLPSSNDVNRTSAPFPELYEGGWQELIPSASGKSTYKNAKFLFHGEAMYLPWRYEILCNEPEEISVCFSVTCKKLPVSIKRIMKLYIGSSQIVFNETIINTSDEAFKFMWGHHPAFGAPFIDESCVINLPVDRVKIIEHIESDKSKLPCDSKWPFDMGNGTIGKVPPQNANVKYMITTDQLNVGEYSIFNSNKKIGVRLSWDVDVMPYLWIWVNCNGEWGYPWFGRSYVVAIEPFSSVVDIGAAGLNEAIENGTADMLAARESKEFNMCFEAYTKERELRRNSQ